MSVLLSLAACILLSAAPFTAVEHGPKVLGEFIVSDRAVRRSDKLDQRFFEYIEVNGGPPSDTLKSGQALKPGAQLMSADGRWRLVYCTNGNLTGYPTMAGGRPFWTVGTVNSLPGWAAMRSDGNLVLNDVGNVQYWETGTGRKGIPPYYRLVMQNDRNIVIYDSNANATWASNTA